MKRNLSELLQHQIDDLDGTLPVDHVTGLEMVCTREEFEGSYCAGSPCAVEAGGKEAPME